MVAILKLRRQSDMNSKIYLRERLVEDKSISIQTIRYSNLLEQNWPFTSYA